MEPDYTIWERKDFGDQFGVPQAREKATIETNQDLQKPIQQLLCDVHEQAQQPGVTPENRQIFVTVRMMSMLARVGLEHERVSKKLVTLTTWLIILTIAIVVLTLFLILQASRH